jgi:acyl-CoA reductase-like NAD-dependent aldehyde dehydrogenase
VSLEARRPAGADGAVAQAFDRARRALPGWASRPLAERLAVLERARGVVGDDPEPLAALIEVPGRRGLEESLAVEVAPVLDAMRWLERDAAKVLAPRRTGRRGRPSWYAGMSAEVRRVPLGLVLVIGPSNYPFMLPAIQAAQALAAGNAVVVKPGTGGERALRSWAGTLAEAGLPEGLLAILDEATETAKAAVEAGADHVVLTGSVESGRAVLRRLAETLTPATMELSGSDAVFVSEDADLDLTARALRFGLELNGGASCIAPRRAFVARTRLEELERRLGEELASSEALPATAPRVARVRELVEEALAAGARVAAGAAPEEGRLAPLVLSGLARDSELLEAEHFGPLLALFPVDSMDEALELDARCPQALGASVFSRDEAAARALAGRVRAGVVTINDCVAPTGDPRLPFGGRDASGFGTTRGPEGLLALTAPQVLTLTRGRRRHLDRLGEGAAALFASLIRFAHGAAGRLAALPGLVKAAKDYRPPGPGSDRRNS